MSVTGEQCHKYGGRAHSRTVRCSNLKSEPYIFMQEEYTVIEEPPGRREGHQASVCQGAGLFLEIRSLLA